MATSEVVTLERYQPISGASRILFERDQPLFQIIHQKESKTWASAKRLASSRLRLFQPRHWMPTTRPFRIRSGPYTIEQSEPSTKHVQRQPALFLASNLLVLFLWGFYILRRVQLLQSPHPWPSSTQRRLWIELIMEMFLSFQEMVLSFNVIFPLLRLTQPKIRAKYQLLGKAVPTVDICVTCCGEPMDISANTIAAAVAQDYPPQRFRVIILDDGRNAALRRVVELMANTSALSNGPQILYRARELTAGQKSSYKSGNLQYGIAELTKIGRSEFFANLDYDMIPDRRWLRRLLPHLLLDPAVALVNPPQVSAVAFRRPGIGDHR